MNLLIRVYLFIVSNLAEKKIHCIKFIAETAKLKVFLLEKITTH